MNKIFSDIAAHVEKMTMQKASVIKLQKDIPIVDNSFKKIMQTPSSAIWFVDGGNSEIIGAASFSLQLIRVAAVFFSGSKRTRTVKKEFFCLVSIADGRYTTTFFGKSIFSDAFTFAEDEQSLAVGMEKVKPAAVASAIRRYAELKIASECSEEHAVVVDGSAAKRYPHEEKLMKALEKNVVFLSKTNSVFCDSNMPASVALLMQSPIKEKWSYGCGVLDGIFTSFLKLHDRAEHVLLCESRADFSQEILSAISLNSKDPVFLGYPYGLVLADQAARVSNEEISTLRAAILHAMAGWKDGEVFLKSMNAHAILDKMRF